MRILDRYIGLTVLGSTFFVMLVLVALFAFFTFAGELNHTSKGSYNLWKALEYSLLMIPSMLYQLFPSTVLIGTLSGLGVLAGNSELIAMRSVGYSLKQILRSVFGISFIMMVLVAVIGEYVAPAAQQLAVTKRSLAMSGDKVQQTKGGIWLRDGLRFIRVGEIAKNGRLHDVNIYQLNDRQKLLALSKIGSVVHVPSGQWLLSDVESLRIRDGDVRVEYHDNLNQASFVSPEVLDVVTLEPQAMSARAAYRYIQYLEDNGVDASNYKQAFWMKLATPLSTLVMVLLAIPIVMGSLRSMTAGHRILIGVLTGVGFYLLSQVMAYVGLAFHLPPAFVAFAPLLLFLGVALRLMKNVR